MIASAAKAAKTESGLRITKMKVPASAGIFFLSNGKGEFPGRCGFGWHGGAHCYPDGVVPDLQGDNTHTLLRK